VEPVHYLGGRYRLIEPLGAGGMSVVWRAYDEVLGRRVAVKLLAPALAADPRSRDRIRDEARAAARLSHPHITAVHDYGESDGVPYVVMELVEGHPLTEHDARPWREAVRIAAEVASALAAAHARGLVHRDVKPANVMLTGDGAKLVDFGISAIAGDLADHEPTRLLGTPAYLAPERLSGAPTAPATDVYALGILLYRMLSGRHPWDADTPAMMLSAHKHRPPKPLPDVKDLPRSVSILCRRCLAKSPADRPSADEVARELRKALGAKSRKALVRAGAVLVGAGAAVSVFFTSCTDGHATTPTAAAAAPIQCRVQYTTTDQSSGAFNAELAVTNAGPGTASDWQLTFRVTGGQVLHAPATTSLRQDGPEVVVTDPNRPRLEPGGATRLALSGQYTSINPLPTDFTLNGVACESVLLVNPPAVAAPAAATVTPPAAKKAPAAPGKKGPGDNADNKDGDHGKGKKRGKD
jgi:serine/threonine-protein kinase